MANRFSAVYAIAKGQNLCMSDDDIHAMVYAVTGKDSLKELNNREVTAVVTRLREIEGGTSCPEKKNFTCGGSKETQRQRRKIYMLMKNLEWDETKICKLVRGDVDLSLPRVVTEVEEISYDDELEKELVYGHGKLPRGYGTGNYKPNGKISMLRDDYEAILEYCNSNGIKFYDLQFPKIVVSYANGDGTTATDVLNNVTFSKRSMKAANGDKTFKVDLDLIIAGKIVWNGNDPV